MRPAELERCDAVGHQLVDHRLEVGSLCDKNVALALVNDMSKNVSSIAIAYERTHRG